MPHSGSYRVPRRQRRLRYFPGRLSTFDLVTVDKESVAWAKDKATKSAHRILFYTFCINGTSSNSNYAASLSGAFVYGKEGRFAAIASMFAWCMAPRDQYVKRSHPHARDLTENTRPFRMMFQPEVQAY